MFNDDAPALETSHDFYLYEIRKCPDGAIDFDLIGTKYIPVDQRGTGPHCRELLDWALECLNSRFHDLGLYYAQFCPHFAGDYYTSPAIAEHYIAWQTKNCLATGPKTARAA